MSVFLLWLLSLLEGARKRAREDETETQREDEGGEHEFFFFAWRKSLSLAALHQESSPGRATLSLDAP